MIVWQPMLIALISPYLTPCIPVKEVLQLMSSSYFFWYMLKKILKAIILGGYWDHIYLHRKNLWSWGSCNKHTTVLGSVCGLLCDDLEAFFADWKKERLMHGNSFHMVSCLAIGKSVTLQIFPSWPTQKAEACNTRGENIKLNFNK